jgi:hypothetical protein
MEYEQDQGLGSLKVMLLLLDLEGTESIHPFLSDEKESAPLRSSTVRKSSPRYQDYQNISTCQYSRSMSTTPSYPKVEICFLCPPCKCRRERDCLSPLGRSQSTEHMLRSGDRETTQASKQTNTDASELQRATECIPSRRDQSRAVPRMMQKRY